MALHRVLFCPSQDTVEAPLYKELALWVDSTWQRRESDTLHQDSHAELHVLRHVQPHKCEFTHVLQVALAEFTSDAIVILNVLGR